MGIVGATGAVGKEIVGCLEKRSFPVSNLRIFGSERSAGKEVDTKFGKVTVELFSEDSARECDVVFLAVDGDFSLKHAENICNGDDGAVVIDNSSAFRYKEGIPLCVPEINAEATKGKKLIANPNCTTAIGLMAVWPLHKLFGLKKMVMSVSSFDAYWYLMLWEYCMHTINCSCLTAIMRSLKDIPSSFWRWSTRNG